ncbi:MAG: UTP--glucose-1-phosphate uridylyltransferase [Chlamydiales bacterium]
MPNDILSIKKTGGLSTLLFVCLFFSFVDGSCHVDHERVAITITHDDFQKLVREREQGIVGYQHNVDPTPMIPASENAVLNWSHLSLAERKRLAEKQEEMFRQGKITMIVMAGGEATRFGGPKTFVSVSEDLGEFLEIKAANLNWLHSQYKTDVPMYILSSEKRLEEFKSALVQRHYYGLKPKAFCWFTQGTIDTFIPSEAELKANFKDNELKAHLDYAAVARKANPDGIYRFQGERRKVPAGHFDAIAAFVISGLLSEALSLGIEFAPIVNIDNLQAILKNDGMIAYFTEQDVDFGFILAEKNLQLTIEDKATGKRIQDKLIIRYRDQTLSFDGLQEFTMEAEKDGYKFVINPGKKTVDVYEKATGRRVETKITIKPEVGGTLVQLANEKGEAIGAPVIKEGFELPSHFDHANAPFFNTNTIIVNLRGLLKFLDVSQEQLANMNFEERSALVREKLIKQVKANFEFKNHEVEGAYPDLGLVKEGKTKILVVQLTRIMLQAAHLKSAKVSYVLAPRGSVFAPVKEPEDKRIAAENHRESLQSFIQAVKKEI